MKFPKSKPKAKKYTAQKHSRACARYGEKWVEENGDGAVCELCKRSDQPPYSTHHIYPAGRYSGDPNLHNDLNMIFLCTKCHDMFENFRDGWEEKFEKLEEERGLKKLFKKSN